MELVNEVVIEAPAARSWAALGERFMHVGEWATPITSSCAVGPEAPSVGATRACTIAAFGPFPAGTIRERLLRFDPSARTLEYDGVEGLPSFVRQATNRWSVTSLAAERSLVRSAATLELGGPLWLLGWAVRIQLRRSGAQVLEELKVFVETGHPHPRKAASAGRAVHGAATLPDSGRAEHG